ncbi:MAG TPA: MotA/TolQ/ExbB proton channel family protein [Gemmataceae bacterium]|nr:MotA/TolQ/ExbB proton channel family protein [Gemmataceae bacterium]
MQVFREFIVNHWYFAIPMFAMSLVAFALVLWRFLLNMSARTNINVFLPQLQDKLAKDGVEAAIHYCETQPGLIPRKLCVAGLETSRLGLAAMRRAMVNVVELEILPMLNFLLPMILAIAKIATMVGLLGTVISMIGTFSELTNMKSGSELGNRGKDIGLALFATALGLVTAIPLVFAHVLFKAWNHGFELKMKSVAQKLLLMVQAAKTPAAAAPSSAAVTPATMRR